MEESSGIWLGALCAVVSGVALGLILAPRNGEKFRVNFRNSTRDFSRQLSGLLSKAKKTDELEGGPMNRLE